MDMHTYDSYKDSGIDWLGEIPSHWEVIKNKFLNKIYNGDSLNDTQKKKYESDDESHLAYISSKDIDVNYSIINYNNGLRIFDCHNFKIAPKNSSLLCIEGGSAGRKIAFTTQDVCFVNKLACFNTYKNYNAKFVYYSLKGKVFQTQFKNSLTGLIGGVSISAINNFVLTLPPLSEQAAIAEFLDKKCEQIDQLIRIKEQQIERLQELRQAKIHQAVTKGLNPNAEMKDSGIDWIGEIPKHWEVKKVKEVSSLYGRIGFRGYNQSDLVGEGEGCITISPSNIVDNHMVFAKNSYLSWEKYYESPEIMIFNDDILIVKTGSTVGKVGIVKNLNEKATINPQLLVLKNIKMNVDFYYEYLHSSVFFDLIKSNAIGSTIPTISETKIGNLPILTPPPSEQEAIVAYLDEATNKIDQAIAQREAQIEKLKEYKQSLINAAVTGKIKVT